MILSSILRLAGRIFRISHSMKILFLRPTYRCRRRFFFSSSTWLKSNSQTLGPSSCASSVFSITPGSWSEENLAEVVTPEHEGCGSFPPEDEKIVERKNERRYRILLSHQFHSSCGCSSLLRFYYDDRCFFFLIYSDAPTLEPDFGQVGCSWVSL